MPHATATFADRTIADATDFQRVEGNIYFPPSSILDKSVFSPNPTTTVCPWKGTASYYDVTVDGKTAEAAAWYYPDPKTERAAGLRDYIAFCKFPPIFIFFERETEKGGCSFFFLGLLSL